jgi:hypothetical protein
MQATRAWHIFAVCGVRSESARPDPQRPPPIQRLRRDGAVSDH